MTVYNGTSSLGEIEDYLRKGVHAFLGTGDERKPLGTYPDRKAAMRAVSEAARAVGEATP
jgi:hypothetical protein